MIMIRLLLTGFASRIRSIIASLALASLILPVGSACALSEGDEKIKEALSEAHAKFKGVREGKNADYIPALAEVDPKIFGIALVTTDGRTYTIGDISSEVSIQSISKVFTMALAMQENGAEAIYDNMGVDATGDVFNSIDAIERFKGKEINAMVNPGAITATSMISGASPEAIWQKILSTYGDYAGRALSLNEEVYNSEAKTNQRNQAIAALMFAYGRIKEKPLQATDIYTKQCSVNVNAKDLATMAATLANKGQNPITRKQVVNADLVPRVLAVMATAGLYDDSGKWLFKTGLPAKSGVGGGILAVAPGKFGIAVISPPLDEAGNSIKAQKAIEFISNKLGGNPFQ
jgi:glutaminase